MRNVFKKFIPQIRNDTSINHIFLEKINEFFILNVDGIIVRECFFNLKENLYIYNQQFYEEPENAFNHLFSLNNSAVFSFSICFKHDIYKEFLELSISTKSGIRSLSYEYIKKNDSVILVSESIYNSTFTINIKKTNSKIVLYEFNKSKKISNFLGYTLNFESGVWKYENFEFDNKRLYSDPESIEEELSLNYDIDLPIAECINTYHKCHQEIKDYSNMYVNEN